MLAGLTFRKEPFFAGADNVDQLYKIARVPWDAISSSFLTQFSFLFVHMAYGLLNIKSSSVGP